MPAPSLRYYVAFRASRDERGFVSSGIRRITGEERAIEFARFYNQPGAWAMVIHPETFLPVQEFGTRFAALPPVSLLRAIAKPPGRADRSAPKARKKRWSTAQM